MNLFDLMAKITLDTSEYDDGLKKSESRGKQFAKSLGSGLTKAAKVVTGAIAAGGAAVAALTTSSVRAYADYEQLSGGVEKLFGKDASSIMMRYAENAYKTAGMSANQFLEQSTSFAAALIQSYEGDTMQAANQANKAMMAISDNFNTFGGDISSVQSAFQGFAKQNYTMLDNLKLGYGGTKTEMERLIKDANEYAKANGMAADLTIENFGDIVEAIDLIQQKQGIAGTTAKEAATTISGSIGMMKAAWQNLLVAFSSGESDLGKYLSSFTKSAETAFNNILPVAEQAIKSIGQFIADVVPMIGKKLPGLISEVLPGLVEAGTSLITSLIAGISEGLPILIKSAPKIIKSIKDGLVEGWPAIKEAGKSIINMVGEGISSAKDWVVEKATEIWNSIIDSLPLSWDSISEKASGLVETLSGAFDSIKESFENLKTAISPIIDSISDYVENIDFAEVASTTLEGVIDALSVVVDTLSTGITTVVDGISSFVNWLTEGSTGAEAFKAVIIGLAAGIGTYMAVVGAITIAQKAWEAITIAVSVAQKLLNAAMNANPIGIIIGLISALVAAFIYLWNNSEEFRNFWINLWDSIKRIASTVINAVSGFFKNLVSSISNAWTSIKTATTTTWNSIKTGVTTAVTSVKTAVTTAFNSVKTAVKNIWDGIKTTISDAIDGAKTAVTDAIDAIKNIFNFNWSLPDIKTPHFTIGDGPTVLGVKLPKISVEWYKKAYEDPFLFNRPTVMATAGGLKGFGDGAGGEIVYGRDQLMRDIREAVGGVVINPQFKLYLDGDRLVGGTSERMDGSLGQMQAYQLRWEGV